MITFLPAFTDNYIWVIPLTESGQFLCVDPGDAQPVVDFIKTKSTKLAGVLITHHHADHIGGIEALQSLFPSLRIYAPDTPLIPVASDRVYEGHFIRFGALEFQILSIPGHTATHVAYYEPAKGWLFCGDTLFSAGCGRVFDGSIDDLFHSIQRLSTLPDDTKIFCAHEYTLANLYFAHHVEPSNTWVSDAIDALEKTKGVCTLPSTIAREKQINPFLRLNQPEIIAFCLAHQARNTTELGLFKTLREQKNRFKMA